MPLPMTRASIFPTCSLFLFTIKVLALKVFLSIHLTMSDTLLSLFRAAQYFLSVSSALSKIGISFGKPLKLGIGLPSVS